jgi:hypothetical protein
MSIDALPDPQHHTSSGHEFCITRAGLVANYYVATPLDHFGARCADVISNYLSFVPPGSLSHHISSSGYVKPLPAKRIKRDLNTLRTVPPDADSLGLDYFSSDDGSASAFAVKLFAMQVTTVMTHVVGLLRLEFPHDTLTTFGTEALVDFLFKQAIQLETQVGNFGFGLKRSPIFRKEATAAVNRVALRYIAVDPCYDLTMLDLRNRTDWAHWITWLDEPTFTACGGNEALAGFAPGAVTTQAGGIKQIQASKLPPVGDVNRGAKDIGLLPGVAQFLKPLRTPLDGLGDPVFDAVRWLERFDDLQNQPWDNS